MAKDIAICFTEVRKAYPMVGISEERYRRISFLLHHVNSLVDHQSSYFGDWSIPLHLDILYPRLLHIVYTLCLSTQNCHK